MSDLNISDSTVLCFAFHVHGSLFLTPHYLPLCSFSNHWSPLLCVFSLAGSHMTSLSSFAFMVCKRNGWDWWRRFRVGGGGVGGSVPAGETKPNTGYLKAEMGGACMPNGDMDQRLISLGAHFNLTTQNTHSPLSTQSHSAKEKKSTVLKQIAHRHGQSGW